MRIESRGNAIYVCSRVVVAHVSVYVYSVVFGQLVWKFDTAVHFLVQSIRLLTVGSYVFSDVTPELSFFVCRKFFVHFTELCVSYIFR